MKEVISVMFTEEEISSRIKEMGKQITEDLGGEPIRAICILKGASYFFCEITKRIDSPVYIDFMSTSSYGNGTESTGNVVIKQDISSSVEGENILIVEDIIDSGNTLDYLTKVFMERGAKSVRLCTLLSKPDRREVDVPVDYVGYVIPDKFVVGYGLDYAQKYRNLPYIGVVDFVEE